MRGHGCVGWLRWLACLGKLGWQSLRTCWLARTRCTDAMRFGCGLDSAALVQCNGLSVLGARCDFAASAQ